MRVLADILEFDLEIDYLPGTKNYIQDILSRRPDYKELLIPSSTANNVKPLDLSILLLELTNKEEWFGRIRLAYKKDLYYKDVLQILESGIDKQLPLQD
jgi:hypothetical protein